MDVSNGSSSGSTPDTKAGLGRALKRSGVKLYAKCSNHKHLHRVLSQLKDVIGDSKQLSNSYATSMKDMEKWASKEEYGALGDVFAGVAEIAAYQLEVQREQMEMWSEFRKVFESILEGQRSVEERRVKLEEIEGKEAKMRKELKKRSGSKSLSSSELEALSEKLKAQENETKTAQTSASNFAQENENIKVMIVKRGLCKLFDGLLESNEKSHIILSAQKQLAEALPDVSNNTESLFELPYQGSVHTTRLVLDAKERIKNYRRGGDPPPVYSSTPPFNPYYAGGAPSNYGPNNNNNNPTVVSPPLYPPINGPPANIESAFQKLGVSAYN